MNKKGKKDSSAALVIAIIFLVIGFFSDNAGVALILILLGIAALWIILTAEKRKRTNDKTAKINLQEFVELLKDNLGSKNGEFEYDDNSDIGEDENGEETADLGDVIQTAKDFVEGLFGDDEEERPEPETTSFDPSVFDEGDTGSILKSITEKKKEEELSDCDSDHEHIEPYYDMPDDEKRRQQLKSMLENGLIDKKEYKIMLKKYGLK